ncbi:MAG: dihydroxyacetone kinase subunit DhaK [Polyangiales bacterium]
MKHFIDDRSAIVTDAIDAAVMLGEGKLARLDGYPAIKVVVRTDWDRSKVAVISGGGAGHEPAHVGFVGEGMLTAAVCGEIFASPSVDAVLAAILAVTGGPGCLLIVKNYTGDRLNFGLAAEKARALGLAVEVVIVGDDIALPDSPRPRGVAGTLFVHKVAGDLARSGASLAAVTKGAESVAGAVRSLGVSLSMCTIPGVATESRIGHDEVELGLGIHGEPGVERHPYRPVSELAATMAARLDVSLGETKQPLALLINDLGGVPPIEMAVATKAILGAVKRDVRLVFGPARLMTSLDMKGLSISILPLDADLERALLSEVGPSAWASGRRVTRVEPLPIRLPKVERAASRHPGRRRAIENVCNTLIAKQAELDALDAKVGDGDTGSTFAAAARAVLADLDRMLLAEPAATCAAIAERLATVMGGSSGILLSIGFSAMATSSGERSDAGSDGAPSVAHALREGVRRIQHYGGASPGDRTMLDALFPAIESLESGGLAAAAEAAKRGAEATASMTKARAGRSGYVPAESLRGVPDPGAIAIASIFAALSTE